MRQALRRLVHDRGFTATALATLALCLAANLVIYSVVSAILLRPLPFPEPERLMTVNNSYPRAGAETSSASIPNYFDRRHAIAAFASVSCYADGTLIVGGAGSPDRVAMARVTPEFFDTLGVKLAQGKMFTDENLTYQTDQVAVLTDAYWRTHFSADPAIVGKTFLNDDLPITIVGVLPAGFRFLGSEARFYRPASHDLNQRQPTNRHANGWNMIARLAPGVTIAEAQAQMDAFNVRQLQDDPYAQLVKDAGYRTSVRSLHAAQVRAIKPVLLLLQAGSLLLLVIGLVNLGNLCLIRASGRAKEFAVRQALGASMWRLAREVGTETLLLTVGGTGLGLLLGTFGTDLLGHFGADRLPLGGQIAFDARIYLAAALVVPLVALFLALPVVLLNRHRNLAGGLQLESRSGTANRSAQRVRQGFIVTQVAVAFMLLAAASLLGLSLKRAMEQRTGFAADAVLTGGIALPWKGYKDDNARADFLSRLLPAIRALPGVTHAAITTGLPFTGNVNNNAITVEGRAVPAGQSLQAHYTSTVSPDYWAAMGIPLLRGRFLTDADTESKTGVCVVDQAFAERYWPGQNPLGRRIAADVKIDDTNASTIVGVVAPVKQNELTEDDGHGAIYFPYRRAQFVPVGFTLVVRATLPPASLAASVRKAVLGVDPGLPVEDLRPMTTRVADSLVARKSPALLTAIFAASAMLLSSLGLYGVMAYAVAQRTREFGIRLALGAAPRHVLRMVFAEGTRLALLGLAAGLVGALLLSRYLTALLFEVKANDPLAYGAVALVLAAVAAVASFLPARRATRVDPVIALRAD
ncbi:MAG TPA: ADOP family duplicated permease [Opitutus sp.]|nr:ADOP family duplicated permease [Opitutus sp.]